MDVRDELVKVKNYLKKFLFQKLIHRKKWFKISLKIV
jgi:hypothetical protein